MNKLKWIIVGIIALVVIIIAAGMYKFNYKASQPGYDVDGNKVETKKLEKVVTSTDFSGNYVTEEYEKRAEGYDWLVLKINRSADNTLQVKIQARNDKKKATCSFDGVATPVSENVYKATSGEYSILINFKADKATISSVSDSVNDKNNLRWFCSGGASLADYTFQKIDGNLDETQLKETK